MDFSLLLSDEEYTERFSGKHPLPYTYELKSGGQVLSYFGTRHSQKPDDPQWDQLEKQWEQFVHDSAGPRIIFFEGNQLPSTKYNLKESIKQFGESGALLVLAADSGVSYLWPDPSIDEEVSFLNIKFEPDLVAYFIFARSAGSWLRGAATETFDTVIHRAIQATVSRIPGAPKEVAAYNTIHERIFGKPLTEDQQQNILRASAPVYHESIINDIARVDSRFRNEKVVAAAERYWKEGYSIFMLFGSAHAIIQEPILRAIVESK